MRFPDALSFDDWERAGQKLVAINSSSRWCLGDWMVYGEHAYTDRYRIAAASVGLDYQTLRNYASVCRRVEPSRRRQSLSFQHHAEIAALSIPEQERWLDLAEQHGWSRNKLRAELRAERDTTVTRVTAKEPMPRMQVDRQRMWRWREAARCSGTSLENWIAARLDDAAEKVTAGAEIRPATRGHRTALGRVVREYETRVSARAPEPDEATERVGDPAGIHLAQVNGGKPGALVGPVSNDQVDVLALLGARMATQKLPHWVTDGLPDTTIRVPEKDGRLLDALNMDEGWFGGNTLHEVFRNVSTPPAEVDLDRVRVEALVESPDLDLLYRRIYHDAERASSGVRRHEHRISWRCRLAGHEPRGALTTDLGTRRPVGVVIAGQNGPEVLWIHRLVVATRERARGIAEGLPHRTMVEGMSAGFRRFGPDVYADQLGARNLYVTWRFDVQNRYVIWRPTGA